MITILDGGMGRALSELGVSLDAPLWSARAFFSQPHLIRQAHIEFIRAGAEVITTNGYALTDYYLNMAGLLKKKEHLLEMSYSLAADARREAARPDVQIAASIPPLNESYRPDLINPVQMEREYPALIEAACENNADIILGETLSSIAEARAILKYSRGSGKPIWISFTLADEGNLRSGEEISSAAAICAELDARAVLLNCSTSAVIDRGISKLASALEGTGVRFGAYANRFQQVRPGFTLKGGLNPIDDGIGCTAYRNTVENWISHGASIVGGCCGFGPEYIRELANSFSPERSKGV